MIPFWIFYMVFDAYRTARHRSIGRPRREGAYTSRRRVQLPQVHEWSRRPHEGQRRVSGLRLSRPWRRPMALNTTATPKVSVMTETLCDMTEVHRISTGRRIVRTG